MSEHVVHTTAVEDARRVALARGGWPEQMRVALESPGGVVELGSITKSGDHFTPALIDELRDKRAWTHEDQVVLQYVLGWLCHRALDRVMKPVFRAAHPEKSESPTECSVYHEAFMIRRYHLNAVDHLGSLTPIGAAVTPPDDARQFLESIEGLAQAALARTLIQTHTIQPDPTADNIRPWILRIVGIRQDFHVAVERYTNAVLHPDEQKWRRYIEEPRFFDPEDPVIALSERLRSGTSVGPAEAAEAIAAPATTRYGEALVLTLRYYEAAGAYLHGQIDKQALEEAFLIGVPGRDGESV